MYHNFVFCSPSTRRHIVKSLTGGKVRGFISGKECPVGWMSQAFKILDKMVTIWIWHPLLSNTDALQKYEKQLRMR